MKSPSLHNAVGFVRRLAVNDAIALSDRELLDRFVDRRDEFAFAELVRRHGPMVLAACRRVLRHEQDAEDAFQATFLVLARRADAIRQGETISGWLYQVGYRLALRARQIGQRRREQVLTPDLIIGARAVQDSATLDDELARLPHEFRSVIVLCYLEGHTQNEAARILATTTTAVNSRLKRAREMLRGRYSRFALGVVASTAFASQALSREVITMVAKNAIAYAARGSCESSQLALALAKGAFPMMGSTTKIVTGALMLAALLMTGVFYAAPSNGNDRRLPPPPAERAVQPVAFSAEPVDKNKTRRGCIILWMSGGPSQIDTFDPKPGNVALFRAIDTKVKGMQFCETLPKLAKQANHLAVIRSMTHRDGDHMRASYLMHTAQPPGALQYPRVGSVLARELGDGLTTLPRYICIDSMDFGPSFLGEANSPLRVGGKAPFLAPMEANVVLPNDAAFEAIDKENGKTMRKNVAKAFDLSEEKPATRDAYGRIRFGNNCLMARRMREAGVPVIEVTLGGWDTHGNAIGPTQNVTAQLDDAFSALLTDLHDRKLLDQTLIVWMGEFGRTPRINNAGGRDHFPNAFTAVLAGAGIKGGQAIGKTSNDGVTVDARPVSPAELHATIYQSLGIDPAKKYRVPGVGDVHVLEKGTTAVKEALVK